MTCNVSVDGDVKPYSLTDSFAMSARRAGQGDRVPLTLCVYVVLTECYKGGGGGDWRCAVRSCVLSPAIVLQLADVDDVLLMTRHRLSIQRRIGLSHWRIQKFNLGGHMASAEREPITGVWERSPWSGGQGS